MRSLLLLLCMCCFASSASAATIHKCTDEAGNVTFTQLDCPNKTQLPEIVKVPVTNSSIAPQVANEKKTNDHERESAQRINKAIELKTVIEGMSKSDVEKSLGTPNLIRETEQMSFDERKLGYPEMWFYETESETYKIFFDDLGTVSLVF